MRNRTLTKICYALLIFASYNSYCQADSSSSFYKLTISPLKFLSGDFGIQYETKIANKLTLDVGVGLTYTANYVEFIWDRMPSAYDPRVGFSGQMSFRRYYGDAGVKEGLAFEPMIRYQRYHGANIEDFFDQSSELADKYQVTEILHIAAIFSHQLLFSGNWILRPFIGAGIIGKSEYWTQEITYDNIDQGTGVVTVDTEHRRNKQAKILPSIKFGIEIGILRYKK